MATVDGQPSFDRTLHQPPRIDKNGYVKDNSLKRSPGKNALQIEDQIKVPDWWGGQPTSNPRKTKTELTTLRQQQRMPDMSFDLDGDGYVGNKDYVLSKVFDKDGDGKLNAEERKNALDAIKSVSEASLLRFFRAQKISSSGALSSQASIASSASCNAGVSSWTPRTSWFSRRPTRSIPCPRLRCQPPPWLRCGSSAETN